VFELLAMFPAVSILLFRRQLRLTLSGLDSGFLARAFSFFSGRRSQILGDGPLLEAILPLWREKGIKKRANISDEAGPP